MQKIKPAEVSALLKKQLETADIQSSFDEVGTVLEVGDGIARVYGLTNAEYGELVSFDSGLQGICLLYTSPSPRDRTRSRMPSSA